MKAVICKGFGDLDQAVNGDFPDTGCDPNDVLTKVKVATVSDMDWLMTQDRYQVKPELLYVPGTDAAGAELEDALSFAERIDF